MPQPLFEVIPARPAVRNDAPTVLEILVRITPPLPEIHVLRPPINLGLVLDRSGSMSTGQKMAPPVRLPGLPSARCYRTIGSA